MPLHADLTPSEARTKANIALTTGNFAAAIEYLQILINYLADSKKKSVQDSLAPAYYKLGFSYFALGNFDKSKQALEVYIRKYPKGTNVPDALIYIADGERFKGKVEDAYKLYDDALKKYPYKYTKDLKTDVYCSMVRCKTAKNKWKDVIPLIRKIFQIAPDLDRRTWAASIGTIAYLKEMEITKVCNLVPLLMKRNSFASRSVALNVALLETGDTLFGEEMYREALWLYRLVYSHKMLSYNIKNYLKKLQRQSKKLKTRSNSFRALMRQQERIGETESEIKVLESIQNYDLDLYTRIAKSYMEINRFREAYQLYIHLHEKSTGALADESLFLAFRCALNLRPLDKAFMVAEKYMKNYPKGEYFDSISLAIAHIHAMLQDWPILIAHLKKTLQIKPDHEDLAEIYFLIAYASFMEEDYQETINWLTKLNTEYPQNPKLQDALYWLGMAKMFNKDYEGSSVDFDDLLKRFYSSQYTEDARFRRAVCSYGLSKMDDAEKRLKAYVKSYPKGKLTGEAYMMLGDIAASYGKLNQAVKMFQAIFDHDINIELFNYSMFRCGEILFENELKYDKEKKKKVINYDAVIAHFNKYLEADRPGSNIPQAIFFIGRSLWQKGEKKAAIERYIAAIKKYGNEVKELGIDMILEEWISKANSLQDKELQKQTWENLKNAVRQAEKNKKKVLALRLKRALCYRNDTEEDVKNRIIEEIVQEKNIPYAGPSTLELIMDEASKKGNKKLAVEAAEAIIDTFTETDYALGARLFIAKGAMKDKNYKLALRHLGVIKEVFATNIMAGEALAMIGDIYIKKKKYEEADKCYKTITEMKEWRKLWPQALFGRGICAEKTQNIKKACAYFERIYVMYGRYKKWTAKAYLQRSQCLERLREYSKAAETLKEMLSDQDFEQYPEWNIAKRDLVRLEGKL
jgi:TolA-binding protein